MSQLTSQLKLRYNQTMSNEHDPLLTMGQAAAELGIERTTIWRAVKAGELPSEQVSRYYLVRRSALVHWWNTGGRDRANRRKPANKKLP